MNHEQRIRVLLVDDHAGMRMVMRQLVEDLGWQVSAEAADGIEGLELARAASPDVIVLDHQMPGRTGLDVLPDMRRLCPASFILMWSSDPTVRALAHSAGADSFADKGIPAYQVTELLREALPTGSDSHPGCRS